MALRSTSRLLSKNHCIRLIPAQKCRFLNYSAALKSHYLEYSFNAALNKSILLRYKQLAVPEHHVRATYLFIDGTGEQLRLKERALERIPSSLEDLPQWKYDGSSTFQKLAHNSKTTMIPRAIYRDPFKSGKHDIIVMCDTYQHDGRPTNSNQRAACQEAVLKSSTEEPWFGIEQEYALLDWNARPYGWPVNGFLTTEGRYYCGMGADRVFARDLVEAHARACLYAGIDFAGTNAGVMPAQWEYQLGPSVGMKAADDLWVSRYILQRIAEEFGIVVSFDAKHMADNWNGAGAHHNMSTKAMRETGGMKTIEAAIVKLSKHHERHMRAYDPQHGKDYAHRLLGKLEPYSIGKFSWGVAQRAVSVRIPQVVAEAGRGYFEDRRPRGNCDPYAVCNALLRTCILNK